MTRPGVWDAYDPKTELPLGGYLVLVCVFTAGLVAAFLILRRRGVFAANDGKSFLEIVPTRDLILLAIATHQLSWMLGRDRVLAPFRALVAHYQSSGGVGELNDTSRGSGLLMAAGDLVTCPYCLGPWVAAALLFAFLCWPRPTRFFLVLLTLVAFSNGLHQLYTLIKHATA